MSHPSSLAAPRSRAHDAAPRTFPLPGGFRLAVRPFPWGETGRELEWRVMRLDSPGVSYASGEAYDLEDAHRRAIASLEQPRAARRQLVGRDEADFHRDPERLTAADRNAIPDRLFALPERRALPLIDAAHVRNAAARLEQMRTTFHSITPEEYRRAKRAILAREADLGIGPFNPRYGSRYTPYAQYGHVSVEPRERRQTRAAADPQKPTRRQSEFIHEKVRVLVHEGYPQTQAVAIAYREAGVPPRPQDVARRRGGRGRGRDHDRSRWEVQVLDDGRWMVASRHTDEDVAVRRANVIRHEGERVRLIDRASGRDVDLPFVAAMALLGGVGAGLVGSSIAHERRNAEPQGAARSSRRDPRRAEIDELRSAAEHQGWRVEKTGSGHWRFVPPDPSKRIVITSSTPSDRNAIHRMRADLRKSGLALEARDEGPPRSGVRGRTFRTVTENDDVLDVTFDPRTGLWNAVVLGEHGEMMPGESGRSYREAVEATEKLLHHYGPRSRMSVRDPGHGCHCDACGRR